jgi:hypothetical protein
MGFIENLMWLIVGAIVAFVIQNILFELFAGPELRFKIKYFKKKLCKKIGNPYIKTILTTKTDDLTDKNLYPEKVKELIKNELRRKGFESESRRDNFAFDLDSGGITVSAEIMFVQEFREEKEIISGVEVNLTALCRYNKFNAHILNLTAAAERIEECLRKAIKDVNFVRRSLSCELKNMYELTGVLAEYKPSSLDVEIGDGYSIDLFENKIVAYGNIDEKITSILQKMITVYF